MIVVIKIGTSSLVDPVSRQTQVSVIARVAETATRLIALGYKVIIVSSGAVGLGVTRLGLKERPTTIAGKQAAAAVGQVRLMNLYDDVFSVLGHRVAQVLLTYETFGERTQYLNARNTFLELLRMGAIPIVNENDTVAVQEIRVGDNDTLSALVSAMVGAQWLFLLTDVDALYSANPKADPTAEAIRLVRTHEIQNLRRQMTAGAARLVPSLGSAAPETGSAASGGNVSAETAADGATESAADGSGAKGRSHSRGSTGSVSSTGPSPSGSHNNLTALSTAASGQASPTASARSRSAQRSSSTGGKASASTSPSPSASASASSATASAAASASTPASASKPQPSAAAPVQGSAGSSFGTGGMATKLKAASLATAAGVTVVIMNTQRIDLVEATLASVAAASTPTAAAAPSLDSPMPSSSAAASASASNSAAVIPSTIFEDAETSAQRLLQHQLRCGAFADQRIGSTFLPAPRPVTGRKRWILSLTPGGSLVLDAGACAAVTESRKSLFPAGVLEVVGDFEAQDAVQLLAKDGSEIARALVNYSADDCRKLRGRKSKEMAEVLGYLGAETLADRDNIVVLQVQAQTEGKNE
jgi:glutamate 5-kinase